MSYTRSTKKYIMKVRETFYKCTYLVCPSYRIVTPFSKKVQRESIPGSLLF